MASAGEIHVKVVVDGAERCCEDAISHAIEAALDDFSEGMADDQLKAYTADSAIQAITEHTLAAHRPAVDSSV